MVSILNKHGFGDVYFGIRDDGTVVGQEISGKTIRDISQSIAENIEPKIYPVINTVKIEGKSCIHVKFEGDEKPYYAFGRAYKRVGDEDRKLSAREIENSILKKHADKIKWESQPSKKQLPGLNEETVKTFVGKANAVGRLEFRYESMENTLQKLGLIENGQLLNAAEVLFCEENPLEVQLAIFAGKDKLTFLDIKSLRGNVFDLLDEMELYITKHMKWRVKFGKMEREEIPEIPVRAIREALVNSVCHRDYRVPKGNEIAIFKNRIEIYNPGDFPEGLTPQDFIEGRERSILRNPLIAQTLFLSKDVEKWGSGLKRIYEECLANRVSVEFWMLKTGFTVVFYRQEDDESFSVSGEDVIEYLNEDVSEYVNGGVQRLYDHIKANPGHRAGNIAEALDVPFKTIQRWIKMLKDDNKIDFVGSSKTGGYYLKENLPLDEDINEGVQKLYDYIKANPGHKARIISESLNVPFKTVQRWIGKLKDDGKIEFAGSGRVGGYYLKEDIPLDGEVNEGVQKLYDYIKANPGHKARIMSEVLNVHFKTVQRWIRKLKDDDKIEFIGSTKTGGYYVKKDNHDR